MKQEKFEQIILEKFTKGNDSFSKDIKKQISNLKVVKRKFTGVGFFTDYELESNFEVTTRYTGNITGIFANYNGKDTQMFVLWFTDGKIDTLEGVAFEDKWRTDYENADIVSPNFSDLKFSSEMKINPMNTIYFTKDQAYYLMFFALDYYFFNIEKAEDLGPLLGALNPGSVVHKDPTSRDPAYFYDWQNIILKFDFPEELTEKQAFHAVIEFLLFYNTSFAIPSKEVVNYFEKEGTNSPAWKDAVEKLTLQLNEQENELN